MQPTALANRIFLKVFNSGINGLEELSFKQ